MSQPPVIDTTFDFRSDAGGKDPDSHSPTLRRYHQQLWSKPLRNGAPFELEDIWPRGYLRHRSELGEFLLSSDTVSGTFRNYGRMQHIIADIPEAEREHILRRGYTMGGMMVFPGNRIDGKPTINQARGFNRKIEDRFDLTLECIRRHYAGEDSTLRPALERYANFFALFDDFCGYVDFFLLQDLVTDDYAAVRFFAPFDDFTTPALPSSVEGYIAYRTRMLDWVEARNRRIARALRR